jgi:DNA-binding transcriptional LysR family regulator
MPIRYQEGAMDMRALRYFSEVVRQNGFRRASATLHVTQPAISRVIGQLEDEFDVTFLIREPRGVQLAAEGEVLYRQAGQILRQAENLVSELRDLRSMVTDTLRVGLPPMTGSTFFGNVITEFRRRYPCIQLHIAEFGTHQLESAVADGRVEIAAAMPSPKVAPTSIRERESAFGCDRAERAPVARRFACAQRLGQLGGVACVVGDAVIRSGHVGSFRQGVPGRDGL